VGHSENSNSYNTENSRFELLFVLFFDFFTQREWVVYIEGESYIEGHNSSRNGLRNELGTPSEPENDSKIDM
jgi:hypothetical protein